MGKPGFVLTSAQRTTYAVGMFSSAIVTANAMSWLLYYYSPPPNAVDQGMVFLAAGVLVGLARLFGSSIDAVTNPLVAFWSDRSCHPGGRRIPFIRRGAVPLMLLAVLIWFPPVRGTSVWNVLWLAMTLGGTWFFYTYVVAPYLALMPELTQNPEERVSLTVIMSYFEAGAAVIAALLVPPVLEALRGGIQIGPFFLSDGFKVTALVLAVLGGLGFFLSVSKIREKPLAEEKRMDFSLWRAVVECFRNPAFLPYLLAAASAKIAVGILMICIPFLATAVLRKGEGFTAVLQAPLFLSTIVGFAVAQLVVNRFGLKRAFLAATAGSTLLVACFFGVNFVGSRPLELAAFGRTSSGDLLLSFARDPEPGFRPPSPAKVSLDEPLVTGDTVTVKLDPFRWASLFADPDIAAFRKSVEELTEDEAAALLKDETAQLSRPDARGREREWMLSQEIEPLLPHLASTAIPYLFPSGKRRFDDGLYIAGPRLARVPGPGEEVHLDLEVGPLSEPQETVNLDGWKQVVSTPEERAGMSSGQSFHLGPPVTLPVAGSLVWSDGSVAFERFRPLPEAGQPLSTLPPELRSTLQDEGKLNALLSRFDLRAEFQWSTRIWLVLALCFLLGFPAAILMSMYRPIVCEVVDLDERLVGFRREAMYFGVEGLLTKMADGISAVVAPGLMLLGHLIAPLPFGYVFPFVAATIFMVLAWVSFSRYPLGR
jgi:Na+/melibiose symporter-like transporter